MPLQAEVLPENRFFLKHLVAQFEVGQIAVVSQDNYYLPRHLQQSDGLGRINFDLPGALDLPAFKRDVVKLQCRQMLERPEYTFNQTHNMSKLVCIKPAPVIVAEGLFTYLAEELQVLFDFKIIIDAQ